jgi:hypothetical protein
MAALDSTMFESHYISRHFEKRCKQSERQKRKKQRQSQPPEGPAAKKARRREANRKLSLIVRRLPKLSLAVHAASHAILAAQASTGTGADHAHFVPLLRKATSRMSLDLALADAGHDSEANHLAARQVLGVRSLIPATIGHGTPRSYYRRLMRRRLAAGPDKKIYGQRWQVETVNSMLKRNLNSACRARSPTGRKKDMLLRAATHNLMLLANL